MKRKGNPFLYLTLLSLLGLLGFVTGEPGWLGFLGFLGWLGWARTPYDERLRANVARASQIGFAVAMVGVTLLVALSALEVPQTVVSVGLAALFVAMLLTFGISVAVFERRGG